MEPLVYLPAALALIHKRLLSLFAGSEESALRTDELHHRRGCLEPERFGFRSLLRSQSGEVSIGWHSLLSSPRRHNSPGAVTSGTRYVLRVSHAIVVIGFDDDTHAVTTWAIAFPRMTSIDFCEEFRDISMHCHRLYSPLLVLLE